MIISFFTIFQRFTGSDEGLVQYFTKDIKNEAIYGLIRVNDVLMI